MTIQYDRSSMLMSAETECSVAAFKSQREVPKRYITNDPPSGKSTGTSDANGRGRST
jgi:hypothetical protein